MRRAPRWAGGALAALALLGAGAIVGPRVHAAIAGGLVEQADPAVIELLSGIDFVPLRADLDGQLGDDALLTLIALAKGDAAASDPGVRIRAIRALASYPGDPAREALEASLVEHAAAVDGVETIYLRAAMGSLAAVAGRDAGNQLAPLLEHSSRDVRAAAAEALVAADAVDKVPELRARLQVETVEQVRLALSRAIQALTVAPPP